MKLTKVGATTGVMLAFVALGSCSRAARNPEVAELACMDEFDHAHTALTLVLHRHVKEGRVDYSGLGEQRQHLEHYLDSLRALCPGAMKSWTDAEKRAFWLNAYNAFTLDLVLDHYPIKSILKIGLYPTSAWKKRVVNLRVRGSKALSLDMVEHEILRRELLDPRIHMALVCASKGCPRLRGEAYRADILAAQLDEQARSFVNDTDKNSLAEGEWRVSPIFKWFEEDFGGAGGVRAFIRRYADLALPEGPEPPLRYGGYDWALNDLPSSD